MVSCGIDIESLSRVSRLYESGAMPLGLFTDRELNEIDSYETAALMFVAKESVLKALGSGWFNTEVDAHDIELSCENRKTPSLVSFTGHARVVVHEKDYDRYSIEFYYFDDDVLAVFTIMGPDDKWLDRSLISIDRSGKQVKEMLSNEPLALSAHFGTEPLSTKRLGKFAIEQAVKKLCKPGTLHHEKGGLQKNESGAPVWILKTPSMKSPNTMIMAVSATHNRNYACGFAISKNE